MRRIAIVLLVIIAVVAGFAAWNVYGAWPVPDGYAFPRHSMWGGGPDGLYEGTLVVEDGCVLTETGHTVIWPPFSSLAIEDGEPVVRIGFTTISMGEPVSLGGGFYEDGVLPEVASGADEWDCPETWFLTTGL
jgi:hypothetical protein